MMKSFASFLERNRDADIFCFQEAYHEAHGDMD